MRPVNLISSEQQKRGSSTSSRSILGYAIVGVLVLVLAAVSALAVFDKKIEERQSDVDSLQARVDAAESEAASLSEFTSFQQVHDARAATIDSLAKSRFDWERVMRELAIVVPKRVWLTNLTGTVSPGVQIDNGAGVAMRDSVPGPALEITGCARNQRTVARLIAAMYDIDGVSRVLVPSSSKADATATPPTADTGGAAADTAAAPTTGDCAVRPSYPTFELVAAFDGVLAGAPVVPSAAAPAATPAATETTPATTAPAAPAPAASTDGGVASTDGGVASAAAESTALNSDVAAAQQRGGQSAGIVGGGDR